MFLQTLTTVIPDEFGKAVLFLLKEYWPLFKEGLKYTITIALSGTLIGLILAILITPIKIQKVSKRDTRLMAWLKYIGIFLSTLYVEILRGTPMMVQAVIIYYGLAGMGVDLTLNFFNLFVIPGIIVTGIAIVSINTSAYIIEVLRGSIHAIDKGQMEAARSIGMTRWQAMRKIIIPQALKNSIPAIGNEFVINIKDTSVLSVIAVTELFYMTRKVNSIYFRQTEGFMIAAIFYLIMTFTITRLLYLISSRMGVKSESYPTSQSFIKKVFTKWK
jgi:putative lysine transport system permease protein